MTKKKNKNTPTILLADDDPDDRMLAQQAFEETDLPHNLQCVEDGEELVDYLRRAGKFADPTTSPEPALVLLDLNMPRKDGREALEEIKKDPKLRKIPIVVLTTSNSAEDINATYDLGVNSYIIKPVTFELLVQAVENLRSYWFETVALPPAVCGL